MPAPTFTLATSGTAPQTTSAENLKASVDAVSLALYNEISAIATGITPKGAWAAATAFPSGSTAGDFYVVSTAGTVDSEAFAVGDWLVAMVDSASTSTYAANWVRADYSQIVAQKPDNPAALIASNLPSRGVGAEWQTKDGHNYKEAASGATDHDLATAEGVKLYAQTVGGALNLRALGLVDGAALDPYLEAALTGRHPHLLLDVDCTFSTETEIAMTQSGSLRGVGNPKITFTSAVNLVVDNTPILETSLTSDTDFRGTVFNTSSTTGAQVGDLVTVASAQLGLNGNNATKSATYIVKVVGGSSLTTSDPSPWDYDLSAGTVAVTVRRPNTFHLSGVEFIKGVSGNVTFFQLQGFYGSTMERCHLEEGGTGGTNFGLQYTVSHSCLTNDCTANGMTYPYNHNYSRNITVRDVSLSNGRHAADATGCIDCLWDGIYGNNNQSTVGIHSGVGIVVRNVVCTNETEGMSQRGIDFLIENVKHSYAESVAIGDPLHYYSLCQFVNEKTARNLTRYRAHFVNVVGEVNGNGAQLPIGVSFPHYNMQANLCDVSYFFGIGSTGIGQTRISNSTLNAVYTRGTYMMIDNCEFKGVVAGSSITYAILQGGSDGGAGNGTCILHVSNCQIHDYVSALGQPAQLDPTYSISNCQFLNISGNLINVTYDNNGHVFFNNCQFRNVAGYNNSSDDTKTTYFNFCYISGTTPALPT